VDDNQQRRLRSAVRSMAPLFTMRYRGRAFEESVPLLVNVRSAAVDRLGMLLDMAAQDPVDVRTGIRHILP